MAQYKSVHDVAWQACGVTLALQGEASLAQYDFNTLTSLFRLGVPLSLCLCLTFCMCASWWYIRTFRCEWGIGPHPGLLLSFLVHGHTRIQCRDVQPHAHAACPLVTSPLAASLPACQMPSACSAMHHVEGTTARHPHETNIMQDKAAPFVDTCAIPAAGRLVSKFWQRVPSCAWLGPLCWYLARSDPGTTKMTKLPCAWWDRACSLPGQLSIHVSLLCGWVFAPDSHCTASNEGPPSSSVHTLACLHHAPIPASCSGPS